MDTLVKMHVESVKREIEEGRMSPTDSVELETINIDNFKINHKGGKTNIAELIGLKEKIDDVLGNIASSVRFLIDYHKDSPIKGWDELEKSEGVYCVGLNLELLMSDDSEATEVYPGYLVLDNYILAEKLINEFESKGGNTKGFEDISLRDTAMWNITSKSRAKKFISFINSNYINPMIDDIMERYNINKVIFTDKAIDFEYND